MRNLLRTAIALAVTAVSLAGCVPSVHPLYTTRDLAFDPELVGVWQEDNEPDSSWTFTKSGDTSYQLVVKEKNKSAPFVAHLLRLGQHRFLDIIPHEDGLPSDTLVDIYRAGLIPGHMFLKVSEITTTLRMAFLDPEWLDKRLQEKPGEIAHGRRGFNSKDSSNNSKDVILTAPTAELQKFMLRHVNDKDAFGEGSELKKKKL